MIETSGLADPGPILQTFATDRALGGEFHVEVVVAVVDAASGLDTLDWSAEARKQIILADRLVVSKTDLAERHGGRAPDRAPARAQSARRRCTPRSTASSTRAACSRRTRRKMRARASTPASSPRPSTATAS